MRIVDDDGLGGAEQSLESEMLPKSVRQRLIAPESMSFPSRGCAAQKPKARI